MSETVDVTISDPLKKPRAVLDQSTGVYVRGETLTITCTVTGDNREKYFNFYKDKQRLSSRQIVRNDNFGTFRATGRRSEGRYACQYEISVSGRQLISRMSETVEVTISDLHKPHLSVDLDGVSEGGDITFNCTSPLERPGIAFYLYRQEEPPLVSVKPPDEDRHAVTFAIKNIDHSKIGNYTCQYEANINGRNLSSPHSDAVRITVRESKSIAPLAAGVGSAAGLILILALLGACLWRK
ncbi:immunoglobulin superfamily member 1-like, partial [Scyliorhinus torazame]|uniref:immunoglobulin superfamily member 1-like n=1 Tax=Scyliorhinus torazame TaxID=75743 RepID=UPI003B594C63